MMKARFSIPGKTATVSKWASFKLPPQPQEYKVVSLRECPMENRLCDNPKQAAAYWRKHVEKHPYFNPNCECVVVLMLSARHLVKGHYLAGVGLLDQVLTHPRELFRTAIVAGAASIIIMHNHPSGDVTPSHADITTTREFIRAGWMLRIEVLDHLIMGKDRHLSLREFGIFNETKKEAA